MQVASRPAGSENVRKTGTTKYWRNYVIRVLTPRVFGFLLGGAIFAAGIGLLGGCGGGASTSGGVAVTVAPTTATVAPSAMQSFTATVSNDSAAKGVTWAASCATAGGCGSLSATSSASGATITYTAPAAVPSPATVTLTATSVSDGTKSASATITIGAAPAGVSVTISPKVIGLVLNQALGLTATVTGDVGGAGVTWTASSGTFSAQAATTATYVAPNSPGSGITITATSKADPTKSATTTIAVTDLAGVTTYHNDVSRDGANNQEYLLTTSNVAQATFGKLFSCTVDGAVYAQPLWVPSVNIGGGSHNVIVVATMRDSVYVFDADTSPCKTYWHQTLTPTGETYGASSDLGSSDIFPDIGILGTPVIDPTTQTVYVVTKTKTSGSNYIQRLHALSLAAGAEATNSPVTIAATAPGSCEGGAANTFNSLTENQRPGLALSNGMVYVAWASHGDQGAYHGWILGYQTANLSAVPTVFNVTPNSASGFAYCRGGIWMSGGAPAFDSAGNMYVISGNGAFDGASGSATLPTDFSDSYIKLSTPNLGVLDYFTPFNQSGLDSTDADVGASGTSVLIDGTGGGNFLVGGSKSGVIYVLDRANGMGKYNTGADGVHQKWTTSPASHAFSTPAFWNNNLYYFGVNFGGTLAGQIYTFNTLNGLFNTAAASSTPTGFGFAGATPSVSGSSAAANGIVWAIDTGAYGTNNSASAAAGPAVLHAYDATNLGSELWNSSQNASRDKAGNAVKFTVPTVANGKVYIGTRGTDDSQGGGTTFGEIDVYGLIP
jgi:hypothetical protein